MTNQSFKTPPVTGSTEPSTRFERVGEYAGVVNLASLYSQLCGVLAGFAFAGLAIYLSASDLPEHAEAISVCLFSAFAALVIIAVLYALLSGESSVLATRRTDASLLIYGLPFGLSIITMFFSLTLMAAGRHELAGMVGVGRFVVVLATPTILLGRLTVAAMDGSAGAAFRPHRLGWVLLVAYVAVAIAMLIYSPLTDFIHGSVGALPGYVGLGSAVAAAVASPLFSTRRPDFGLPPVWVSAFLVFSFAILLAYAALALAALK